MRYSVGTVGIRKILTLSLSSVFVLPGSWRAFPYPPPGSVRWYRSTTCSPAGSLLPHSLLCPSVPIASGISSSSDSFSPITRDHMREPVIWSWATRRHPPHTAGTLSAEWLSSAGGSPRFYPLSRAPYCPYPLRSSVPSSVTPSRGRALPPWLRSTPWINVMTCLTVQHDFHGPSVPEVSYDGDQQSSPRCQRFLPLESFLLFRGAYRGFGSRYLYVSMYCFLRCLRSLS